MSERMKRLETLVFDYEGETIQAMLEFATELRNRRLRYCADRRRLFQQEGEALSALSSTPSRPPSNNQRYLNNADAPPSTPNQRNYDPNSQINTVDRRRIDGWIPGACIDTPEGQACDNSLQSDNGQPMPIPMIRVTAATPTNQSVLLSQTYSLQVPRDSSLAPPNDSNSSGGGGSTPARDERGQSTPSKPGGDGNVQFPPPSDGGPSISEINSASGGGSSQQSQSSAYPRDTTGSGSRPGVSGTGTSGSYGTGTSGTSGTATSGTTTSGTSGTGTSGTSGTGTSGTYGTGTSGTATSGTYGPGSTGSRVTAPYNPYQPCRHTSTMAECPICHGALRILLMPLCEGSSSVGNSSVPTTITTRSDGTALTNPSSYGSSGSRPTTLSGGTGTIAEIQYNTDVSISQAQNGSWSLDGRTVTGPTISSCSGTTGETSSSGSRPTSTSTGPSTLYEGRFETDVSSNPQSGVGSGGGYSSEFQQTSSNSRYPRDTTGNESCPSPNSYYNASRLAAPVQLYHALFNGGVSRRAGARPLPPFYRPDLPYGKKINKCQVFNIIGMKYNNRNEKGEPFEFSIPPPPPPRHQFTNDFSDSESASGETGAIFSLTNANVMFTDQ